MVEVKWNPANRKWYEDRGYKFTKMGDVFIVKAEDLSVYSKVKVKVICDYCNNEYETMYYSYMNGRKKKIKKDSCLNCGQLKHAEISKEKNAKNSFDKARQICDENGYILLSDESEYTTLHDTVIRILCPIHGEQTTSLANFIIRKRCPQCGLDARTENNRLTKEYVEKYINSINNNTLLNKDDYVNANKRNLKILCGECGENIFITSFNSYYAGHNHRCKHCINRESRGEFKVRKFLENSNIKFIQEYYFDDCRYKLPLRFDFYLPDYNVLIEFDGQQHYDDYFYKNKVEDAEYSLNETIKRDRIKDEYCKEKNIKLIRIPYFEEKNINKILKKELCI